MPQNPYTFSKIAKKVDSVITRQVTLLHGKGERSYRRIHKKETGGGEKGILMLQRIFFNPMVSIIADTEPG